MLFSFASTSVAESLISRVRINTHIGKTERGETYTSAGLEQEVHGPIVSVKIGE